MKLKTNFAIQISKFIIPFIIGGIFLLSIYLFIDRESSGKLIFLIMAYLFPPLGKESIIPIGVGGGDLTVPIIDKHIVIPAIDPLLMALTIALVDIIVALFLVWNYDLAKKIPIIGKFIKKIENVGRTSSDKYKWIKPLRFVGVVLFVMVPFQGSGGVVGSIVGRLIGMKPWTTFVAIAIGAFVGCLLIAYFAEAILSVFVTNFLLGLLILIIILVIGIMIWISKKNKNAKIEKS